MLNIGENLIGQSRGIAAALRAGSGIGICRRRIIFCAVIKNLFNIGVGNTNTIILIGGRGHESYSLLGNYIYLIRKQRR